MYRRTNAWEMLDELASLVSPNTTKQNNMDIEDDVLTMTFDVPGLSKSDVDIVYEGRVIHIMGENGDRKFDKQYKLNEDWDISKTDAKVLDGVLSVSIPKIKEKIEEVKKITIK